MKLKCFHCLTLCEKVNLIIYFGYFKPKETFNVKTISLKVIRIFLFSRQPQLTLDTIKERY